MVTSERAPAEAPISVFCQGSYPVAAAAAVELLKKSASRLENAESSLITKLVNSNIGLETSFPVSVVFTTATLPSKQTAQAAAEHKQEVSSLNLNFS